MSDILLDCAAKEAASCSVILRPLSAGEEDRMHSIIRANIDRYVSLLQYETDLAKRATIVRLLAEERLKLEPMPTAKKS